MIGQIPAQVRFQSMGTPTCAYRESNTDSCGDTYGNSYTNPHTYGNSPTSPTPTASSTPTPTAAWSNTLDPATADTNGAQVDSAFAHIVSITLGAGSVQKLRVYIGTCSYDGTWLKIALYDNSLNLLVSNTSVTVNAADSGTWKEVTVPDTVITAGTYKISWTALAGSSGMVYRYQNGNGTTKLSDQSRHGGFSGFPTNPFVDALGSDLSYAGVEAAGVYIAPITPTPTPTPTPTAAWSDTLDPATADTNGAQVDSAFAHIVSITLGAGSVQKLRVYIGTCAYDGTSLKIALYDNSLNLLVSNTSVIVNAADRGTWKEVTVPDTVITAGIYKIAWTALAGPSGVVYRYRNGNGTTKLSDQSRHGGFSGFPTNPLVDTLGSDLSYPGVEAAGVFIVPIH